MDSPVLVRIPEMIAIGRIHPNSWNPNFEQATTFNKLVAEIEEDGFDQPLQVVEIKLGESDFIETWTEKHYRIIGGEHRYKAAIILGMAELPCVIYEDWDEKLQKLKTVRRNLLSGELDSAKFTKLVNSLRVELPLEALPDLFGFKDVDEFNKFYVAEKAAKEALFLDGILDESRKERYAVDSVSDIIGNILRECGETLDQDYLFFSYKGAVLTVVLCDAPCSKAVKDLHARLRDTGERITPFITSAIQNKLSETKESIDS